MKRRLKILNFPNRFSSTSKDPRFIADPSLRDPKNIKCVALQQGMLKLILDTVERLMVEKKLTPMDLSRIEELQKSSSHIRLFIDLFYTFDKDSYITSHDLFESYKRYCCMEGFFTVSYEKWIDPGQYDRVAKSSAQLNQTLMKYFPDHLILCREDGDRSVKGLKERPITENFRLNFKGYDQTQLKDLLVKCKLEQKMKEQKDREKNK